ncbi:hypothetical protein JCM3770_001712 [Rhodotorula araucariae]
MDPPPHLARPAPPLEPALARTACRDDRGMPALSAQIRDAKGLALELKGILKRTEPWNRDVEFQRESLRKAYLRVIFSPALLQPSSAPVHRTAIADGLAPSASSLKARSSTATGSSSSSRQQLDILNLLWLDTSHALIQSYRARLAALDKQLASAPKAHRGKGRSGGGGDVQSAAVGPVARRKLMHAFRQFLAKEEDLWRTLCGRLASRLAPGEAHELRAVGVVPSDFLATSDGERGGAGIDDGAQQDLSDDERRACRAAILPLAHKALICYGDLARYAELYNEASVPVGTAAGGKKESGRRGGKSGGAATEKRVKNYSKAADCYNQARLLLPDNGNPSNQLAVLAQYSSDPLASIYHYYRALSVRTPFTTARANLQITFAKAVSRWFSAEGGEPDGDAGDKFRATFIVLEGILFTKEKLVELPTLSLRLQDLFRTVLAERIFTSDVVARIVVTSLSALWDARMSRSASQASLVRSKTGSTAALASTPALESVPSRVNLEPEALVHVLSLFTTLLNVSTTETIDLYTSNAASVAPGAALNPAQNISAVLRRALPALRILSKWLVAQLEYIARVEARVEASEGKRAARARTSTGTAPGGSEEAQQPLSLDSSGSAAAPTGAGRVSLAELRGALDALWAAYADYASVVKLAFPPAGLPTGLLDQGGWLEEDVELLGFAPLRRAMRPPAPGEDGTGEIRRVGRDVHPNDEQLMRIADGQRDAIRLAGSPLTRVSIVDGAYVFTPRYAAQLDDDVSFEAAPGTGAPAPAPASAPAAEDEDMLDQVTDDDPVDRAMRVAAADKLDMGGVSDIVDDEDEDEDDEEQIVYPGSRSSSAQLPPGGRSRPPSYFSTPSGSPAPARAAVDLRQQLFHTGGSGTHSPAAAPSLSPSSSHMGGGPSLLAPTVGGSPSLNPVHSIWAPTPGMSGSTLLAPAAHAPAPLPLLQQQQQQQKPVTPRSFESIPNLTHGSPAAQAAGWPSTAAAGAPHGCALPPPPVSAAGDALYGGAFAATSLHAAAIPPFPHMPPPTRPPGTTAAAGSPGLSTAFTGLRHQHHQQQQQREGAVPPGLSPFVQPFGARPQPQRQPQPQPPPPPPPTYGQGGWPTGYS